MIKGFSEQTEPLNEYEQDTLLPIIIRGLRARIGKESAVINRYIVSQLKPTYNVSEARVRKIINHIRTADLIPGLIATSDGYFIAETEKELRDYEESLLGRELAIRQVRESIARQRRELYDKTPKQAAINF
ncbi:MAG: hypothetical protein QM305_11525 [Bacteroidota bacterium]|nr:hypothetical protein [Bacteroidota bacterium]